MIRLEQLTLGTFARGRTPSTMVKVVQVEWLGDRQFKVTFEEPTGAVRDPRHGGKPG